MGTHDLLIAEIEDHSLRFLSRIDELKLFLAFARTTPAAPAGWSSGSKDARALAIVCTMAELEALVRTVIQRTHEDLTGRSIQIMRLIPSVRQVVAHTTFESLRDLQDSGKVWDKRHYATTLERCGEVATFPVAKKQAQPPLDGRTLRPEHFYRLWSIYSLPGDCFSNPHWPGSLLKLCNARNDLAHGNLPYGEIFQQAGRRIEDVESYVNDVGDFAAHYVDTWCDYLKRELYLL